MRYWLLFVMLFLSLALVMADNHDDDEDEDDDEGPRFLRNCGNGECNGRESCLTCPQDCGSCELPVMFTGHTPADGSEWREGEDLGVAVLPNGHEYDEVMMSIGGQEVDESVEGERLLVVAFQDDIDLEPGTHAVRVWLVDDGDEIASTTWSIVIAQSDDEAPRIDILTPDKGMVGSRTFWFNLTTSEPATCTCSESCNAGFDSNSTFHSKLVEVAQGDEATLKATCTDQAGNSRSEEVKVEFESDENRPPVWDVVPEDREFEHTSSISIEFAATDPDGDEIEYDLDSDKEFAGLDGNRIRIFPPDGWEGSVMLNLRASDGEETISKDFTVTIVLPEQQPPANPPPAENPPVNNTPPVNETPDETVTPAEPEQPSSSGGGGRRRGGGGGGIRMLNWTCGPWSLCVNGVQTQECTRGTEVKIETDMCEVIEVAQPDEVSLEAPLVPLENGPVEEPAVEEDPGLGPITGQATYISSMVADYKKPLRYMLAGWAVIFLATVGYIAKRKYGWA